MNTGTPAADEVKAALDELLGWPPIARSTQLAGFLRYVVQRTLAGEESSIKAYAIAVDVFGRPDTFDPQTDPIVRVQARRLRTLLEQFYEDGNGRSGVRIVLPLGRYVPAFEFSGAVLADHRRGARSEVSDRTSSPARPLGVPAWPVLVLLGLIVVAVVAAILFTVASEAEAGGLPHLANELVARLH